MKQTASRQKLPRQVERTPNSEASAGPNGIAVAPPAYGLEVVDRFPSRQRISAALRAQQPSPVQPRPFPSGAIQAKLTVNPPGDIYEQEADRVADQVMRMPEPRAQRTCPGCDEAQTVQTKPLADQITPLVQRQEETPEEEPIQTKATSEGQLQRQKPKPEEEEKEPIQTKPASDMPVQRAEIEPKEEEEPIQARLSAGSTPTVTPAIEAQITALRGGGQPLPGSTRAFFEPRFGADFSDVRIHTDARAAESARVLSARAFTVGRDVVFGAGQYAPGAKEGNRLLAHELTHVVQQQGSHLQSRNCLQCWGPGIHKELTRDGVRRWLPKFSGSPMIDKKLLSTLADYSKDMDLSLPELWFNFRGLLVKTFYGKEKALKKLQRLYSRNSEHARNHGEGGLYAMPVSDAKRINEIHQLRYEQEAKKRLPILPPTDTGMSFWSTRPRTPLALMGDAFHVAQDRGAHGEGAALRGHARQILEGINPDDPKANDKGYTEAQQNTKDLVLRNRAFLYNLLVESNTRTGLPAQAAKVQPVPSWNQLPKYAKADLERCELNEKWFNEHTDDVRLTVLNLYVKLKGMGLWHFVGWNERTTQRGCFHFLTPKIEALRAALRESSDFTRPQASLRKYWNSREMRSSGSLEFKHFEGWPVEKVEAHIDQIGLLPKSKLWWFMPLIPLGHMAAHGLSYDSYKDVFGIRNILLQQGWDRQSLLGTTATTIQRKPWSGDHILAPMVQNQIESLKGQGKPLTASTRNFFESRFGYSFSSMRVHTDGRAAEMARALNAQAFTVGRDVVFGAGQYKPGTVEGRRLLAHELTHVVQQSQAVSPCEQSSSIHRSLPERLSIRLDTKGPLLQAWWVAQHAPKKVKGQTHELITETVLSEKIGSKFSPHAKSLLIQGVAWPDLAKPDLERVFGKELTSAAFHGWGAPLAVIDGFINRHVLLAASYLNNDPDIALQVFLGAALHAAQDKAAHKTPCKIEKRTCKPEEMDNPSVNTMGWKQSFENTRKVFRDFLNLLDVQGLSRLKSETYVQRQDVKLEEEVPERVARRQTSRKVGIPAEQVLTLLPKLKMPPELPEVKDPDRVLIQMIDQAIHSLYEKNITRKDRITKPGAVKFLNFTEYVESYSAYEQARDQPNPIDALRERAERDLAERGRTDKQLEKIIEAFVAKAKQKRVQGLNEKEPWKSTGLALDVWRNYLKLRILKGLRGATVRAQSNFPEGFTKVKTGDKATSITVLKTSPTLISTLAHEAIHYYASPSYWKAAHNTVVEAGMSVTKVEQQGEPEAEKLKRSEAKRQFLIEGMAEYFTLQLYTQGKLKFQLAKSGYDAEVKRVAELSKKYGEETLRQAYFAGNKDAMKKIGMMVK